MVTKVAIGVYRVEGPDGRSDVVHVAGEPGNLWAFWNGRVFRQRDSAPQPVTTPRHGRVEAEPLIAPMPGTVLKIHVTPGAAVRSGDAVVILEAMKMELPLRALDDAVVQDVRCREGELVQADAVLVTFKAER